MMKKETFFLGIESSCDETSAAVLTSDYRLLSNIVLSQDEIHAPYGGVVPELASRQHIRSIGYVVDESLRTAGVGLKDIDNFAVTQGPGLIGSLLVGLSFAKGLAYCFKKPLYPVDHLEAHVHSVFLENRLVPLPALALLVSGGHTSIYLLREKLDTTLIARTRDDAAGEALDKIAKFLGLGYPGGPIVDRMASQGTPGGFAFSLPRMRDKSLDYSFSGLKTAALKHIREEGIDRDHPRLLDFLASFQDAVVDALLSNLERALDVHNAKSVVLGGGVARNSRLRSRFLAFGEKYSLFTHVPQPEFCTDNAAMVACLAALMAEKGVSPPPLLDLNAYARKPE
jgi:N6-L-threonylcarbamoyladenine synthase